ncbi:MAG: Amuc_1098 family type IV pilus outer membrane protein [Verrucomicrobiales bacterium]
MLSLPNQRAQKKALASGALCLLLAGGAALAGPSGSPGTSAIAQQEIARRQALINDAAAAIQEGDALRLDGDTEAALEKFRGAYQSLSPSPLTAEMRRAAGWRWSDAAVAVAENRIKEGRYDEAQALLEEAKAAGAAENHKKLGKSLEELKDPTYFNRALTPDHTAKAQEVEGLLREGRYLSDAGFYDEAVDKLNQVLEIDRHNTAARRSLEKVEQRVMEYEKSARDHTRAAMIREVDQQWESPVPPEFKAGMGKFLTQTPQARIAAINFKFGSILPVVELQEATLEEAIQFLQLKSKEMDPSGQGVNFVISQNPDSPQNQARINLSLRNIPLGEALRYVTQQAGMTYRVDEFVVRIVSLTEPGDSIISRTFTVPPDFIGSTSGAAEEADPFSTNAPTSGITVVRMTARKFLEEAGVPFPPGATASYNPSTSTLLVRNTAPNIQTVEAMIAEARGRAPKQVKITVRSLEFEGDIFNEESYDWLLGAFNLPGTERVFGAGGTVSNAGPPLTAEDFPFTSPSGLNTGRFPLTAGNRSGLAAVRPNRSIGDLIAASSGVSVDAGAKSPGILGLAGVFSDPAFQLVLRGMSQMKNVEVAMAPAVVTKSGQRAKIDVIRELLYPIEFDPPEIPQQIGFGNGNQAINPALLANGAPTSFPVTPATPTAFEMREVGVTLEVEPVVGPDNQTVDLTISGELDRFEGFIDYGLPITAITNGLTGPESVLVTTNQIIQPIFKVNRINTAVSVWDRSTVVLGGLVEDNNSDVEDKTPILGSLPGIGRFFRSEIESRRVKSVIFYVTVEIIDPAGRSFVENSPDPVAAAAR